MSSYRLPLLLVAAASAAFANWPQWRGPQSAGVSPDKDLPTSWSAAENIRWKTPIPGRGHSSPIVWGTKVFVTTAIEGPVVPGVKAPKHMMRGEEFRHPDSLGADRSHTLKVLCLDRDSGKVLWERTAHEGTIYDDRHRAGSYASATPVTDGRYVYAYFGSPGVFCYDFNGKLIWKFSPGELATMGMGVGVSPVLHENLIFLVCDQEFSGEGSFMVALDKTTGKQAWRAERAKAPVTWSTPVVVRAGKRHELVVGADNVTIAYDPATGKELWRANGVGANAIPSPVVGHGMVFLSAGYPTKHAYGIRAGLDGDLTDSDAIAWKYDKGAAYVPSPILYGDYLYLMTDAGLLTCLDARTGAVLYEGGRPTAPGRFFASPVAYDGKILITSQNGDTFVIKAGPKHEVLATNSLGEAVSASLALAAGRIFIRGEKHLYCIGGGQ